MKRFVSVFTPVLIAVFVFFGCSPQSSDKNGRARFAREGTILQRITFSAGCCGISWAEGRTVRVVVSGDAAFAPSAATTR